MASCRSSGPSSLDRAVEPTKSQTITVNWRSSADGAVGGAGEMEILRLAQWLLGLRALRRIDCRSRNPVRLGAGAGHMRTCTLVASRRFWLESEGLLPCHLARRLKNFCDGFPTPAGSLSAQHARRPVGRRSDCRLKTKPREEGTLSAPSVIRLAPTAQRRAGERGVFGGGWRERAPQGGVETRI